MEYWAVASSGMFDQLTSLLFSTAKHFAQQTQLPADNPICSTQDVGEDDIADSMTHPPPYCFRRYPFAFRQCGLGVATGLLLLCFCACQMSMQLLLASSQLSNRRSIEDLATHCFGRPGRIAVQFCIFSLNMG